MKVLLFGGSGWLGHHIALNLAAKKYDLTIVTRGKKQTYVSEIEGLNVIHADKHDEAAMKQIFETPYTHVIDTVPTERSIELIHKYATHIQHYIHCSSTGGYTPLPFIPCNETAHYKGFAPGTGWDQKRIVDNQVMQLYFEKGFPATVIRPCYITGPGLLPLDNLGGRRTDFIADIIAEKTLDLPVDGKALLQPIHVKDLANSFYLSMAHPNSIGQIYNICLSHAFTLNDYLALNASAFKKKVNINYMSVDAMLEKYGSQIYDIGLYFMVEHMCFSIEKAARDLEYKPEHTPEDAVIESALWAAKVTNCKF
ncbi:MAG: NAD-dependent epimerase/dehydratase family protein [Lentisphaeria bacterium]|nr:NAD-dependent epimerase/dehydratase family protein [Lentisphaeria bacterium]